MPFGAGEDCSSKVGSDDTASTAEAKQPLHRKPIFNRPLRLSPSHLAIQDYVDRMVKVLVNDRSAQPSRFPEMGMNRADHAQKQLGQQPWVCRLYAVLWAEFRDVTLNDIDHLILPNVLHLFCNRASASPTFEDQVAKRNNFRILTPPRHRPGVMSQTLLQRISARDRPAVGNCRPGGHSVLHDGP